MSFADGWPRCQKILEMILCRLILSLAHCDLFAAMHILLQRSIALVNPGSSRAQLHLQVRFDDLYPRWRQPRQRRWTRSMVCCADAGEWMKGMEHVAVRAHPGFLQQTEFKACFWAGERMAQLWFAVALAGITPHPPYSWSAGKESAGQPKMPKTRSGGVKRLSACSLPGDADDAIRI